MALSSELIHAFPNVGQLGRLAGARIGVADLLEPGDELEHMLDPDLGAEGLQVDDAVPFGLVVAAALLRVQFDGDHRHQLGGQVL